MRVIVDFGFDTEEQEEDPPKVLYTSLILFFIFLGPSPITSPLFSPHPERRRENP